MEKENLSIARWGLTIGVISLFITILNILEDAKRQNTILELQKKQNEYQKILTQNETTPSLFFYISQDNFSINDLNEIIVKSNPKIFNLSKCPASNVKLKYQVNYYEKKELVEGKLLTVKSEKHLKNIQKQLLNKPTLLPQEEVNVTSDLIPVEVGDYEIKLNISYTLSYSNQHGVDDITQDYYYNYVIKKINGKYDVSISKTRVNWFEGGWVS